MLQIGKGGVATETEGVATETKGVATETEGVATETKGVATETEGAATETEGVAMKEDRLLGDVGDCRRIYYWGVVYWIGWGGLPSLL